MTKLNVCTIYLIRHGESEWNKLKKLQGQKNPPLTALGEHQALQAAKKLQHINFDAIFTSDLLRAKRTAEIIKLDRELEITATNALRERHFGSLEGKLITEYELHIKELLHEYKQHTVENQWKFTFAKRYESDEVVATRFITFLREIALAYAGKTIAVVSHQSALRIFLAKIGFLDYQEVRNTFITNAGFIKLESDGIDFSVKESEGIIKDHYGY